MTPPKQHTRIAPLVLAILVMAGCGRVDPASDANHASATLNQVYAPDNNAEFIPTSGGDSSLSTATSSVGTNGSEPTSTTTPTVPAIDGINTACIQDILFSHTDSRLHTEITDNDIYQPPYSYVRRYIQGEDFETATRLTLECVDWQTVALSEVGQTQTPAVVECLIESEFSEEINYVLAYQYLSGGNEWIDTLLNESPVWDCAVLNIGLGLPTQ